MIFGGAPDYDPAARTKIDDAFKFLDIFLENSEFLAGDKLTIADLALVATVSTFDVLSYDISGYKNVNIWYNRVKDAAPGYEEANGKNALIFKTFLKK